MEIFEMTALEVAEKIRNGEFTAVDAVNSVAKAVEEKDKTYNCYTHLNKELALEKAEAVQKQIESGNASSVLAGVPVAIKDNICTKGDVTSCSSKILYNFKPPYDATVIKKLDAAGIVPCSFCGVTGLKPTYGAVSRYGLIAYASSLDQIGPIGKNTLDVAAMFSVISGKDEKDATSMNGNPFTLDDIKNAKDLKGKKVGIPSDYFGEGISEDVAKSGG